MTDTDPISDYPLFRILDERKIGVRALAREAGIARETAARVNRGQDVNEATAMAVKTFLGVHLLDIFTHAGHDSPRYWPRRGTFTCPAMPGRGGRTDIWERAYGTHPQAEQRRAEAREQRERDWMDTQANARARYIG